MTNPRESLVEAAMLWATLRGPAYGVVEAAVNALINDVDSPTLAQLAGCTHASARNEVPELWPTVAAELGLPNPDLESQEAQLYAARATARSLLDETRSPEDIARILNKEFHGLTDPRLEAIRKEENIAENLQKLIESP